MRDMTLKQFRAALDRHGFRLVGFMGYVDIGGGVSVCYLNAGNNHRAQLAYLLQQKERIDQKAAIEAHDYKLADAIDDLSEQAVKS